MTRLPQKTATSILYISLILALLPAMSQATFSFNNLKIMTILTNFCANMTQSAKHVISNNASILPLLSILSCLNKA